jgi:hypothetical protein
VISSSDRLRGLEALGMSEGYLFRFAIVEWDGNFLIPHMLDQRSEAHVPLMFLFNST